MANLRRVSFAKTQNKPGGNVCQTPKNWGKNKENFSKITGKKEKIKKSN